MSKRWQFAALVSPDAVVAAAVANFGYLGYAFAYAWEREGDRLHLMRAMTPLGLGALVAWEPDGGLSRFSTPAGLIRFDPCVNALAIDVPAFSADVAFAHDARPFDARWAIGGRPHRTRKLMGEAATGVLRAGGREVRLAGLGLKDWSAGTPARETAWRWVAGAGRCEGRVIAWNLRTGFDDADEVENAIWLDGEPVAVGRATLAPDGAWAIAAGDLVLTFEPDGAHEEAVDYGLVASRYVQPWGTFRGTWAGRPVVGHGVVEDHWARW